MNATPLSAEEIAYYLARLGDEPGGSMSEILMRRLLATVRAREADVEVRDNDIFAAYRAIGAPQTVELHAAVDALRRERDQARTESRVYAATPRHRDIEILRTCEERGRTEAETIDALLGHLLGVASQRDYLKRREADIIEACERVADGGQYRADIVAAIQRLRRERDEARAEARAEALAWRALALARCSPVVAGIYGEREIEREVSAMRTLRGLGIDPDASEGT